MRVFAGFSMVDGQILEDEIDSSLAFMRYDYPPEIYKELRSTYEAALREPQDIQAMAEDLAEELSADEKILLAVQLFVLLSRAPSRKEHLIAFYLFMNNLGVASEAIDLVYQLDEDSIIQTREEDEGDDEPMGRPLETIRIGATEDADLVLENLPEGCLALAFRYRDLVLLKNLGSVPILVRGRRIVKGDFCRLYGGHRVVLGEVVLGYDDLTFYFNAKKDVSSSRLYLSFGEDGTTRIERSPSRSSELQIDFGLATEVKALRETEATIEGVGIGVGHIRKVRLGDRLEPPGSAAILFSSLGRRARDLGGKFQLEPSRSTYEVSNNPGLLGPGDILLSSGLGGDMHLRIHCDYAKHMGTIEIVSSPTPVFVDDQPVRGRAAVRDGGTVVLGEGRFLRCDFSEGIIEEQRTVLRELRVEELSHAFDNRETALDSIGFKAVRGEMVCVMGPSGCGKSTLLRSLAGQLRTKEGSVLFDGFNLYDHLEQLRPLVAFMPQEDAIDPLLTVGENLSAAAAIRCPHLSAEERDKRVRARAVELGLAENLDRLAGTPENRALSGGERKRLNLGLDMTGIADVYLLDEPTSGLSSKDSEHVLEIIRSLADNKIVLVSIHQPSARLFGLFDKALLLDRGGVPVFFGTPTEMLQYFANAREELESVGAGVGAEMTQPEEIFDILERPLREPSGDVLYEDDARGHLSIARRFPPDFWRDRFQAYKLRRDLDPDRAESGSLPQIGAGDVLGIDGEEDFTPALLAPRPRLLRHKITLFWTLLKRSFLSRLRSRGNLVTTLLAAPGLAMLIATVLRYSEDDNYTFAAAFHIPTYLFLSLVVAMLLGLTNSADEIIRDRPLLSRERNHRVPVGFYVAGKVVVLGFFALVQMGIYLLIGNVMLAFHSMFWDHLLWMFLTSMAGVSGGLFISSLVRDAKTALNLIPIILIPNIILGGALIKYEEMNRDFDFVYSIRRWLKEGEDGAAPEPPSRLRVPVAGQFMPLRWSYEAMVIRQDRDNPLTRTQVEFTEQLRQYTEIEDRELTEEEDRALYLLKEALSKVSGIYAEDERAAVDKLYRLRREVAEGTFDPDDEIWIEFGSKLVGADEVFVNRKLQLLVQNAENERKDIRKEETPNVFFGTRKRLISEEVRAALHLPKWTTGTLPTVPLNCLMLLGFIAVPLALLLLFVKRQLNRA